MTPQAFLHSSVGDIVAHDLRSATVMARHGIDFCCGGRRTLADACAARNVDPGGVVEELAALDRTRTGAEDVTAWSTERLVDNIVSQHHEYVRAHGPVIAGWLAALVAKYGRTHPALLDVARIFAALRDDLDLHMRKEEVVLFPRIVAGVPPGQVAFPIAAMEDDHDHAAAALERIYELTRGYTPPSYGCATWRAACHALAAFDADLRRHVHLENNVLFPAARAAHVDAGGR